MKFVALVLKIGFYIGLLLLLAGFVFKGYGYLSAYGIYALLFTPYVFVLALSIFYLFNKDYKIFLFSIILLGVLIISTFV